MGKSHAKKIREKRIREGQRNPELSRSAFADRTMYKMMQTKKTKTKKDIMQRVKHKGGYQVNGRDNDPFYYAFMSCDRLHFCM